MRRANMAISMRLLIADSHTLTHCGAMGSLLAGVRQVGVNRVADQIIPICAVLSVNTCRQSQFGAYHGA
jgi:hypothetical protein